MLSHSGFETQRLSQGSPSSSLCLRAKLTLCSQIQPFPFSLLHLERSASIYVLAPTETKPVWPVHYCRQHPQKPGSPKTVWLSRLAGDTQQDKADRSPHQQGTESNSLVSLNSLQQGHVAHPSFNYFKLNTLQLKFSSMNLIFTLRYVCILSLLSSFRNTVPLA